MKRVLMILLLATLTSAFSCRHEKAKNSNVNANAQANSNVNMNTNTRDDVPIIAGEGTKMGMGKDSSKLVTINIGDDPAYPGKCSIVDPGAVTLSKKDRDKVTWCVINTCTAASGGTVTVDNFTAIGDPARKNPFGVGSSADNSFDIAPADYKCKVKTKEATSGEPGASYKYDISIKVGTDVKAMLDPVIVIASLDNF